MHKLPLTHTAHTHTHTHTQVHISSNLSVFLEHPVEFLHIGLLQLVFLHTPCRLCSCLLFRWQLAGYGPPHQAHALILLLIVNIPLIFVLWLVNLKLLGLIQALTTLTLLSSLYFHSLLFNLVNPDLLLCLLQWLIWSGPLRVPAPPPTAEASAHDTAVCSFCSSAIT